MDSCLKVGVDGPNHTDDGVIKGLMKNSGFMSKLLEFKSTIRYSVGT